MGKMTYEDGYRKLMHLFSQLREITRGNSLAMLFFLHIRRFHLIEAEMLQVMRHVFHEGADIDYMRHYWQECLTTASYRAKERGDATDASVVEEAIMAVEILLHEQSGSLYVLYLIVLVCSKSLMNGLARITLSFSKIFSQKKLRAITPSIPSLKR